MATQATYRVSTRRDKDQTKAEAKSTVLVIDFSSMTEEDYQVIGAKHIVISRQNFYRKHGIPGTDKVLAKTFVNGARQSLTKEMAIALGEQAAQEDVELRAKMIQRLTALGMKK